MVTNTGIGSILRNNLSLPVPILYISNLCFLGSAAGVFANVGLFIRFPARGRIKGTLCFISKMFQRFFKKNYGWKVLIDLMASSLDFRCVAHL
jgi:hypothetical protein